MLSNNHVRASQRQLGEVYSRVTFFVSPHLASIVVLGVLAAGCSISPTAVTNDPATSAVQATTLSTIRNAFSATDSEWPAKRERLVCDAHRVLAALDRSVIADAELSRATDLISSALLNKIPYDDFRSRYPSLHRLVAKEIGDRRVLVKAFPVATDDSVTLVPDDLPCITEPCPQTPLAAIQNRLQSLPGLSVPAVLDLTDHHSPSARVHGLLMIIRLRALMAMTAFAKLQSDTSTVTVADSDSERPWKTQVRHFAAVTPLLATRYAFWHPPTIAPNDVTELRMSYLVRQVCRSAIADANLAVPTLASLDGWGHPIHVSAVAADEQHVVLWSAGPNARPGDSDDVIRYLRGCGHLTEEDAPLRWTAAGGGGTPFPGQPAAFCN
jgi:hypothetical protein